MPPARYAQARYWLLTLPGHAFTPYQPPSVQHIQGQLEIGAGGFLHWQVVVTFKRKQRLRSVVNTFGPYHAEPTRSDAARAYVFKEDTRVDGTQFEIGDLAFRRNNSTDWANVRRAAESNDLGRVPDDIYIRHYGNLRRIAADHMVAPGRDSVRTRVFWGATNTGKTRTAWQELPGAYPKDPRSKWWCGYQGQAAVIVDEFRGGVDIGHLLRWLDRYPVIVETKGSTVPLRATEVIITSNLHPRDWYPELDDETKLALMRRLEVTHFARLE